MCIMIVCGETDSCCNKTSMSWLVKLFNFYDFWICFWTECFYMKTQPCLLIFTFEWPRLFLMSSAYAITSGSRGVGTFVLRCYYGRFSVTEIAAGNSATVSQSGSLRSAPRTLAELLWCFTGKKWDQVKVCTLSTSENNSELTTN